LARRKLASAAAHLNARSPYVGSVPHLVLMTDDERLADPLLAARLLPRGTMIVVRSREDARRSELAHALMAVARHRGLVVLIADDGALAVRCGADGLHLSEAKACQAAHWRALKPRWFISASAHGLRTLTATRLVDAYFLSPVFPTRSHPGAPPLTPCRANRMAMAIRVPVYALGGVTAQNAVLLHGFAGIAAIGALAA
jgi:thiamine-phosphate pyrophosphorylase